MTRNQAISLAIQALSKQKRGREAIEVLQKLADDLPFVRWSDAGIRDAIDQYILDHGKVPTATDFKKGSLPPHTVVKKMYGKTLKEWMEENYPVSRETVEDSKWECTLAFIEDYNRIKPRSGDEYNRKRETGLHCWYTIALYNDIRTWRALLKKLDLVPYFDVVTTRIPPVFKVNIISDYDFTD